MTRCLTEDDLLALEIGAGILGTGGGGDPYLGRLRAREVLREGRRIELLPIRDLADDAVVIPIAGVGAPTVSSERIKEGQEGLRALRALESHLGVRADALACPEIGGANAMEPLIAAALAGVPVVDADGMGRAFPEMQMTTFSIAGHRSTPSAMSDPHGNVVIFETAIDERAHERMARAAVIAQGGSSTIAVAPMTGAVLKSTAVPESYARAMAMGRQVLQARADRRDPIEALTDEGGGRHAFNGKITDLRRDIAGGFVRGSVHIDGAGAFAGQTGWIDFRNEYLVFRRDGRTEIVVPDLIVVADAETGEPLSTDVLRYGQRVAILALPAHDLLKTERALKVVGPAAFEIEV